MITVKYSTKAGQKIVQMGTKWSGNYLHQVYNKWSQKKEDAFHKCYDEYLTSENHSAFGICSANCHMFTVSWLCTIDGENVMIYKTHKHTYKVLLDK